MPAIIDLTGKRFGRLTVIEKSESKNGFASWLCECDCGEKCVVCGRALRIGKTKSCGCLRRETTAKTRKKHGKKNSRLYRIWTAMKARCTNPQNKRYIHYGGRGIKVCSEWMNSFEAFYEWAMENGYKPDAKRGECTIDRINNDGDYCPANCRWATTAEQNQNKRVPNGMKIN